MNIFCYCYSGYYESVLMLQLTYIFGNFGFVVVCKGDYTVHGSRMQIYSVAFLSLLDEIKREREGVESGVSAHHQQAEIRCSLITGFL